VSAWWLSVQGRVWGPYDLPRLEGYVREGRLAPHSLVSPAPDTGFARADGWPALRGLFPRPAPPTDPLAIPERPRDAAAAPGRPRSLLVLAALKETAPETLEQALAAFGPAVRIRGFFWLLRARLPAAGLRNALTRRLGASDFLFVVEADLPDAAWFNLDGEADRALRRLWTQSDH
jgi:hypothetical protein